MARILIIEDHYALCQLYQSVLGQFGHEVILAQTGEAGVAAAGRVRPDLVILDLMLPGMSGADVAHKLREEGILPRTPLIITTALGDAQAIANSVGAASVLAKPFDINTMLTLVHATVPAPGGLSQSEQSSP